MKSLRSLAFSVHLFAPQFASLVLSVAAATLVVACHLFKASGFGNPIFACGANTLTNLIPDTYAALKVVSRELVGLIPAVNRDSRADRLALNQSLRSAVAPVNTAGKDITPAMSLPAAADQVMSSVPFTLTKMRAFPFSWSGEEQYSIAQGPGLLSINQQQIAQAFRAGVGEIATDLYAAMRKGASRAYGTAGTTPFASDFSASAQLRKILDDNGTPGADRHLVMDTTAGANARTLLGLGTNAHAAITADTLTQGVLVDSNGFKLREDAKITSVTKGTGTGYLVNNGAGYAAGTTAITVDTGTGTILAGDVITFAGDTNKYVVATALAANVVTLAEPGLRAAVLDNVAITVGNSFTANLGFSRDFAILGTRLPSVPSPGDIAIMRETITDPVSGLSFELAAYPGYRMVTFELGIGWGVAVENPEHGAILLG
jgi:hypothetical protein